MSKRWPDKYIVGLTGNIATGKSAVLQLAAEQGALALDADHVVHKLLDENHFVKDQIIKQFGRSARLPDGRIDREVVAKIVFNDPVALAKLEKIVHPAVRSDLYNQIESSDKQVIFIEAIKLLEGSLITVCRELWVTRCSRDIQIDRLVSYRQMDRDMAVTRVDAQTSQNHKIAVADVVIDTSGTLAETKAYFTLAWAGLIRRVKHEMDLGSTSELQSNNTMQAISTGVEDAHAEEHRDVEIKNLTAQVQLSDFRPGSDVTVRRAQLADLDLLIDFMTHAVGDESQQARDDLISDIHHQSYFVAQHGGQIKGVVGLRMENWVAAIDRMVNFSADSATEFSEALLKEVVATANELICEVVIAPLDRDAPTGLHNLYLDLGFEYVDSRSLPSDWQKIVEEVSIDPKLILVKMLRDTRRIKIKTLTREIALAEAS